MLNNNLIKKYAKLKDLLNLYMLIKKYMKQE